jgi:hypothetical protein
VCEAIGYVLSSMPIDQAAEALRQFCAPSLAIIQTVANSPPIADKPDLQRVADAIEQIDAYLVNLQMFQPYPAMCLSTPTQVFPLLAALLEKYAKTYFMTERISSLIRRSLAFFPTDTLTPILQSLVEYLVQGFAQTGYPSFIWIIGKITQKFALRTRGPPGEAVARVLATALESITSSLELLLTEKVAVEIPDGEFANRSHMAGAQLMFSSRRLCALHHGVPQAATGPHSQLDLPTISRATYPDRTVLSPPSNNTSRPRYLNTPRISAPERGVSPHSLVHLPHLWPSHGDPDFTRGHSRLSGRCVGAGAADLECRVRVCAWRGDWMGGGDFGWGCGESAATAKEGGVHGHVARVS